MLVRNKDTGDIETLRYGAAMEAVAAGTHAIVNEAIESEKTDDGELGEKKPKSAKPSKPSDKT